MSQATLVRPELARPGVRVQPWHRWQVDVPLVLLVYVVTRVWGFLIIHRAGGLQGPSIWTGRHSGYFAMAQLWDAQWYKIIVERGYPVPLPVDAAGVVQQSAWAFFPGFPYTVKVVMWLTGLPYSPAAVLLNLALGACAVVVLLRLLQRVAGRGAGFGAVVLLCTLPAEPVLQIAYSEALALLLFGLALLWLVERRYLLATLVVLPLALTRPVVAPFALVVLAHLVGRWRARRDDPFPRAQQVQVVALGLFSAACALLWPALVQVLTGVPSAYLKVQGTWLSGGTVGPPFGHTLGIVRMLWGVDQGPWWLALGAACYAAVVLSPLGRGMGTELRTWCLAYPPYVLSVIEPWTSTYRYALFLFPMLVLPGALRRFGPALVLALALLGLAYQVRWVDEILVFVPPADSPP